MRRSIFAILLLGTLTSVAAAIFISNHLPGVRVTVINRGPDGLSDLVVHVTGNNHPIGNLAVGQFKAVRVQAQSKSHVELSFVDSAGCAHRLNAGGYFNSGFRGTILIELEDLAINRNEQHIEISQY